MRFLAWRCFLLLFYFALIPTAQAQLFVDDDARQSIQENADEIEKITGVLRDLNERVGGDRESSNKLRSQSLELRQQQQQLQQQLREVKGQLEEFQHVLLTDRVNKDAELSGEMETMSKRVGAMSKKIGTLTEKMAALEKGLDDLGQWVTLPSEDELYSSAYNAFQQTRYLVAIDGFNRVLKFYPAGKFNANAQYWLGQTYLMLEEYEKAKETAELLVRNHPQSDKQPAALLTIARAMQGLGAEAAAQSQLRILLEKYPTSLAADEARQLLTP